MKSKSKSKIKKKKTSGVYVYFLCGGIFLLFIIISLGIFFRDSHLNEICTAETTAEVIDTGSHTEIDTHYSDDYAWKESTEYYAIIEYRDKQHRIYMSRYEYKVGDKVEILYNSDDPDTFIVKRKNEDKKSNIVFIAIFGGISVIFFGVGIGEIIKEKNNK